MSNVRCDGIMRDTDALPMTVFHYFSCFEIRLHPTHVCFNSEPSNLWTSQFSSRIGLKMWESLTLKCEAPFVMRACWLIDAHCT